MTIKDLFSPFQGYGDQTYLGSPTLPMPMPWEVTEQSQI